MDFDLFELDDDDEILSSICDTKNDSETEQNKIINPYPILNCRVINLSTGNNHFSQESFIKNSFLFEHTLTDKIMTKIEEEKEETLTVYKFSKDCLSIEKISSYILQNSRMNIQILFTNILESLETDEQSHFEQRKQITLMYHMLLSIQNDQVNICMTDVYESVKNIRTLLNSIISKEILSLICTANSPIGNATESATYHFLHGFLEWKFLDLLLIIKQKQDFIKTNEIENLIEEFSQQYKIFINDLCILSLYYFKKNTLVDLVDTNCFPCVCIEEIWLLLQFLSEKHEKELNFWRIFNSCVENIQQNYETYELLKQNAIIFELWLLKGVLMLEGYKTNGIYEGSTCFRVSNNYELVEKITELFLSVEPTEEQIRVFLLILMPVILEWCNPKPNIPMILWEYFYKKINSSFYITGSASNSLAVASLTGRGYLEKIKSFLNNISTSSISLIPDSNITSFTLFLLILGKTIRKFIQLSQLNQIHKILGRVFVKFSLAKFLALTEIGIHHLIELFITLVISSELKDIGFKLRDELLSISLEKLSINRQICLTKGHVALLIHFFEENIDISEYVKKLLKQLSNINNDLTISKIIIDGMCDILKVSENFNRGEHFFIDSWLSNYLNACTSIEAECILEVFHNVFEKIKIITTETTIVSSTNNIITTDMKPIDFFNVLSTHISPFIKHSLGTTTSALIPLLAADFCILTAIFNDQQQFKKQFKSFLEATNCNRQSTNKFILAVLNSKYASYINSAIIIQIWLKSLVLLSVNDEDVINLTSKVAYLEEFQNISNLDSDELLLAQEPLCIFISAVGRNYKTCDNFQKKCEIADKFNSYLISFDKWILDKNEKTEILYKFYSFIAVVIFNCANIVYIRSKVTCFFHIAMTRFILPCSVQLGKVPDLKLCQIIHKIWPVVIQGIGKLNFKSDPYITKTLTDLIVKWTPNFKMLKISKPFINCINSENEELSSFVFDKLATTFLASQRGQPQSNALLINTIFNDVVMNVANNELKLKIFVESTILTILEHLMMVDEISPTNKRLLELLEKIISSLRKLNSESIRNIISEKIKLIVTKYLSYYTFFCFQLLTKIAGIYLELIEEILPFLKEQIIIVETKRGSGSDSRLRSCLEKLQETILAVNTKNNCT